MISKKLSIIVVIILISASIISAILYFSFRPTEENLAPWPCITAPSQSDELFTNTVVIVIYGNSTEIVTVDLNLEEDDIVSASFEYSSDGENWINIGVDGDPSFEGEWYGEEGGVRNGVGFGGWNIEWNTSGLAEGKYYIKSIMTDESGQIGECQREVYYDPTPPIPEIYEPYYQASLDCITEFKVTTDDEDIVYMKLEYLNGSNCWKEQKNIGKVSQHDVGPNVDGSKTFDKANNFCGPAAAANALWRLGQKNADLLNLSGKSQSNVDLAKNLSKKMERNQEDMKKRGTTPQHLARGIKGYLEEVGLDCGNTEHGYRIKAYWRPNWKMYEKQIRRGEAVILFIVEKGEPRSEGHFVTGVSAKSGSGSAHQMNVSDPKNAWNAATSSGTWTDVPGYDDLSLGGKQYKVQWMCYVSPKNSTDAPIDVSYGWNDCGSYCMDHSPDGGWSAYWDNTAIKEGVYLLRATMIDSKGNIGAETILVEMKNVPPEPCLLSPINSAALYGDRVIIYGDSVEMTAADLCHGDDIVSTLFEYSIDGLDWIEIGIDDNGSVEGDMFTCGMSSMNWLGGGVWNMEWNTSGLSEGAYYIRAIMTDRIGQIGEHQREVYYDPTPPIPRIDSPSYKEKINGSAEFSVTTADEDIVHWNLEYYNGSAPSFNQEGLGDVEQDQVGPDGKDGKPRYCAPTAAANSLWRLAQANANLTNGTDAKGNSWSDYIHKNIKDLIKKYKDDPAYKKEIEDFYDDNYSAPGFQYTGESYFDNEGNLNEVGLAMILACKMGTDPNNGTKVEMVDKGIKDFLKEEGVLVEENVSAKNGVGYTFTSYRIGSESGAQWEHYEEEMRKNESVTITIYKYRGNGPDGIPGTADDETEGGGHDLSGKDGRPHNDTHHMASFRDTNGADIEVLWWDNMIFYGGAWYIVYEVRSVSLQTTVGWIPIGETASLQNIIWDTTEVHDGFYVVRATMTDDAGNIGRDTIVVEVDNTIPTPEIINPSDGDMISGTVYIVVEETSGQVDVDYCDFEHSIDGITWTHIGLDEDGSDGWTISWNTMEVEDENYSIRATMADAGGDEGEDVIEVTVDNTLPIVEIIHPIDGDWVKGIIEITATDTDPGSDDICTFEYFDGIWKVIGTDNDGSDGWSAFWDTASVPDNHYFIRATVSDAAGNQGSDMILVKVDNTPPETEMAVGEPKYGENPTYVNDQTELNLTAIDTGSGIASTWWIVYNETSSRGPYAYTGNFTLMSFALSDGHYNITFNSTDNVDNIELFKTKWIYLDNTPPETEMAVGEPHYSEDPTYVNNTTELNLTAIDTGSGVASTWWRVANETYDSDWQPYIGNFTIMSFALSDGHYNITFNSTDNVGNVESIKAKWIYLDNTPPEPWIVIPTEGESVSDIVHIIAIEESGTDDVDYCEFYYIDAISEERVFINFGVLIGSEWHVDWDTNPLENGIYYIEVVMADHLGNEGFHKIWVTVSNP